MSPKLSTFKRLGESFLITHCWSLPPSEISLNVITLSLMSAPSIQSLNLTLQWNFIVQQRPENQQSTQAAISQLCSAWLSFLFNNVSKYFSLPHSHYTLFGIYYQHLSYCHIDMIAAHFQLYSLPSVRPWSCSLHCCIKSQYYMCRGLLFSSEMSQAELPSTSVCACVLTKRSLWVWY